MCITIIAAPEWRTATHNGNAHTASWRGVMVVVLPGGTGETGRQYTHVQHLCAYVCIYMFATRYMPGMCVCECVYLDAGLNNFVLYLLSVCDCACTCIGRYFMKLTATAMRASSEPTPNRDHLMLCYAMLRRRKQHKRENIFEGNVSPLAKRAFANICARVDKVVHKGPSAPRESWLIIVFFCSVSGVVAKCCVWRRDTRFDTRGVVRAPITFGHHKSAQ